MITIKITIYPSPNGTPLGFDGVDDRQPSVRYAINAGRIKNKIGASGAH